MFAMDETYHRVSEIDHAQDARDRWYAEIKRRIDPADITAWIHDLLDDALSHQDNPLSALCGAICEEPPCDEFDVEDWLTSLAPFRKAIFGREIAEIMVRAAMKHVQQMGGS